MEPISMVRKSDKGSGSDKQSNETVETILNQNHEITQLRIPDWNDWNKAYTAVSLLGGCVNATMGGVLCCTGSPVAGAIISAAGWAVIIQEGPRATFMVSNVALNMLC